MYIFLFTFSLELLFFQCIIHKSDNKLKVMVELSLLTLLNLVGNNFCEYREYGYDSYKSLLLAYSDASHEYGPLKVKNVIEKSNNFKVAALALAAVKCPEFIIE